MATVEDAQRCIDALNGIVSRTVGVRVTII